LTKSVGDKFEITGSLPAQEIFLLTFTVFGDYLKNIFYRSYNLFKKSMNYFDFKIGYSNYVSPRGNSCLGSFIIIVHHRQEFPLGSKNKYFIVLSPEQLTSFSFEIT
jgi:hypothetical protein